MGLYGMLMKYFVDESDITGLTSSSLYPSSFID